MGERRGTLQIRKFWKREITMRDVNAKRTFMVGEESCDRDRASRRAGTPDPYLELDLNSSGTSFWSVIPGCEVPVPEFDFGGHFSRLFPDGIIV